MVFLGCGKYKLLFSVGVTCSICGKGREDHEPAELRVRHVRGTGEKLHSRGGPAARDPADLKRAHCERGGRAGLSTVCAQPASGGDPGGPSFSRPRRSDFAAGRRPAPRGRRTQSPVRGQLTRGYRLHARPRRHAKGHRPAERGLPQRVRAPGRRHQRGASGQLGGRARGRGHWRFTPGPRRHRLRGLLRGAHCAFGGSLAFSREGHRRGRDSRHTGARRPHTPCHLPVCDGGHGRHHRRPGRGPL